MKEASLSSIPVDEPVYLPPFEGMKELLRNLHFQYKHWDLTTKDRAPSFVLDLFKSKEFSDVQETLAGVLDRWKEEGRDPGKPFALDDDLFVKFESETAGLIII